VDQGGLQPWQVLEMATRLAARYIGAEKDLGTIEAGKVADLAIVEGNPLANFRELVNVVGSMKNGNYYAVADLLQPYAGIQSTAARGMREDAREGGRAN
jgi:imidazolonepropionase-like amidohydrolase